MTPDHRLRPELPALPRRIADLPVDARGYPVPWFVEWIDGVPEFRIMDGRKLRRAVSERLCWVCGQPLGSFLAFTIGPMCAVNRVSAEPPSHRECSIFSARACPFLTRPHMRRREAGLPEEAEDPGGVAIRRNPGVALVWTTKRYKLVPQQGASPLFRIGEPTDVQAFARGLRATPAELRESIVTGLPALVDMAEAEGAGAIKALEREVRAVCELLRLDLIPLRAA